MRKSKVKTLNVLPKNISALLKILDNNPKDLNANKAIGQYFVSTGEHDKCLKYFSAALLIQPNAENYYNLGVALHQIKKLDDALVMYDECINLDSNFAEAYSNRGAIYRDKYNFTEALTNYLKAIELKPAKLDEYLNFSIVLFNLNKFQDALEICNHAISEGGISERRLLLKYEILFILGRLNEAKDCLEVLSRSYPESSKVLWALACNDLIHGDFHKGWERYESRWRADLGIKDYKFNKPKWLGNFSINGLTLLVHAEQGLGDTIHFCRYLNELSQLNAKIIFLVQAPLFELLKNINGVHQLIPIGSDEQVPEFDAHIPLLSLPLALKTEIHNIPNTIPYIFSNPEKSHYWHDKFIQHKLTGFKVGLVWNGGFRPELPNEHSRNERRNISIDLFKCFKGLNALFFSLQKGEPSETEFKIKMQNWDGPKIFNFMDEVNNFTDTAAIIDQLDLVISVDTSTAHLAGAMGKKVWMLNRVDSCWRWIVNRTDSPWYPTMKIYQQQKTCEWNDVMQLVRNDLIKLIDGS